MKYEVNILMFSLVVDWAMLFNWIIGGFIGAIFGAVAAGIKYRFDRKRDNIEWERKLKLSEMESEREYRLIREEVERILSSQTKEEQKAKSERVQASLMRGLDNPGKAIKDAIAISLRMNPKTNIKLFWVTISVILCVSLVVRFVNSVSPGVGFVLVIGCIIGVVIVIRFISTT